MCFFDPTRSQAQRTVFLVSIWVARYAQLCSHNSAGAKESNVSHSLALPGPVTHAPAAEQGCPLLRGPLLTKLYAMVSNRTQAFLLQLGGADRIERPATV